jgi:hypothetical protein
MLTLKQFMSFIEYRIGEGSEYLWNCYGDNVWNLDSTDDKFSIVYDTGTQEVFEVKAYDYKNQRAYRMINPDYKAAYIKELADRAVQDEAWEGVDFIDLELDEDWIEKAQGIADGVEYDTRVQIPIDLRREEMFELMKIAHERDITLNQLVAQILLDRCSLLQRKS